MKRLQQTCGRKCSEHISLKQFKAKLNVWQKLNSARDLEDTNDMEI